jgi:hypothetical protein
MRSRPVVILAVFAMVALLLSSCDAFFTTNLFKAAGLGQVSAADLAGKTSAELTAAAYSGGDPSNPSAAFFDALAGNASAKADVLATLAATYGGSGPAADVQEAAALAAQIELITTGADGIVNNVVALLASGTSFSAMSSSADIVDAAKALIPADLAADKASFTAAITALLDSGTAYTALGTSIGADGVAGNVDLGTAAQSAVMAAFLGGIDPATALDPGGSPYTNSADLLWDLVQGTPGVNTAGLGGGFTAPVFTAGTPLGDLVGAAGLDTSSL